MSKLRLGRTRRLVWVTQHSRGPGGLSPALWRSRVLPLPGTQETQPSKATGEAGAQVTPKKARGRRRLPRACWPLSLVLVQTPGPTLPGPLGPLLSALSSEGAGTVTWALGSWGRLRSRQVSSAAESPLSQSNSSSSRPPGDVCPGPASSKDPVRVPLPTSPYLPCLPSVPALCRPSAPRT